MDPITVETTVNIPVEKAWEIWTTPEDICNWSNASEDWHTPSAENDPREGGKFLSVMAARDGSASFDFSGVYTRVVEHQAIKYTMDDGRKVTIKFEPVDSGTRIIETFDPETENPIEMQREGWQSIMDNFKKYAEQN